ASVAVSSWTLVAISCERYYAICHPLRSRRWQTRSHAYKIIACIWCGSMLCMLPIAMFSQLMPTSRQGYRKCRENWPSYALPYERTYNLFLDLILLVLPLMILSVAYILITRTLYVGMRIEKAMIFGGKPEDMQHSPFQRKSNNYDSGTSLLGKSSYLSTSSLSSTTASSSSRLKLNLSFRCHGPTTSETLSRLCCKRLTSSSSANLYNGRPHLYCMRFATLKTTLPDKDASNGSTDAKKSFSNKRSLKVTESVLRRNNIAKNLESKKRVVKMLSVLVLEFFICWTPLYVINTVAMYIGSAIYEYIDYTSISALQLLAYSSSCCNPITYCFMNANFRRAFWDTFKGMQWCGKRFQRKRSMPANGTNLCLAGSMRVNSCTVQTVIDSPRL
ncbi:hypothetical protein DOY81_007950, partial [Sarcophaga bullata]